MTAPRTGQRAADRRTAATKRAAGTQRARTPIPTAPDHVPVDEVVQVVPAPEVLDGAAREAARLVAVATAAEEAAANSTPPAPPAAPLAEPSFDVGHPRPVVGTPHTAGGGVTIQQATPSVAAAERDLTYQLIDMATRQAPDPSTLFRPVTAMGSNVRCTRRLVQRVTFGPNQFISEQLVCFPGQEFTGVEARRILAVIAAQAAAKATAADVVESAGVEHA